PANIGDFPSATSVFDIDAVGLIRTLSRFNQGVDMAGNTIGTKCAFTIAAAFNPMAHDLKLESERLSRKIDAGLNIIYTQPLFDQKSLDIALEKSKQHNLPLFVGVMPLRSLRHAEFMHNEVPGIEIPEILLKTLETIDENDALEFGIEVAQKFATQVRTQAQGLYLMPPFGNHTIAERVLEAIPNLNQTEKPHQIDL
ncbi:MAG: methylenetetrahydrofolate reductase, partial [Candidatus Nitrosotenuis sp.]